MVSAMNKMFETFFDVAFQQISDLMGLAYFSTLAQMPLAYIFMPVDG